MDHSVAVRNRDQTLRASLAGLYATLKRAAVRGVVPVEIFSNAAGELGLSVAERARLIGELARLDLRIAEPVGSTQVDPALAGNLVRAGQRWFDARWCGAG